MFLSESHLRRLIRKLIIEKGGVHQFHGAGDAETLTQYKSVPGPKFGKGKGSVVNPISDAPEEIKIADKYIQEEEPDELIAYSRGGAMVQELDDEEYKKIKKIKYVAPAAKRGWTPKPVKPAPSGSEAYADSGDSLVSLTQVAQIASDAGIKTVKVYHDRKLPDLVGKPTGRKDKETGKEKISHWRGVGIFKHQTAADKGIGNKIDDNSEVIEIPANRILQAAGKKEIVDWKGARSKPEQVEQQWNWVNNYKNESTVRNVIREILLEKKKVKCPLKNGKRDYKCEYKKYGGASKKGKKDRAARNQARKVAKREGRVKKGDGKEIDHKKPLSKGGSNAKSNQRVVSRATNRKKGNK